MVPMLLVTLANALAADPLAISPPSTQDRVEAWQGDVMHLVAELERLHPDPYFGAHE